MNDRNRRPDGVQTYPADGHDSGSYRDAEWLEAELLSPVLLRNAHERLYVSVLDGTGNSMLQDAPESWSAVAKIHSQIEMTKPENIASGYVEGIFTQQVRGNLLQRIAGHASRLADGLTGHTFDERVETAYFELCQQSYEWLKQDPQAQIRVASIGFSRGAEEAAALTRMIHERGIRDPTAARYSKDDNGLIDSIRYSDLPPLVPPGHTLQAALLYDPVATGLKEHDRRLAPSVMSAFQITSEDERRDQFTSTNLLPPGLSEGNRFLNVTVGGAHSDVGDSYRQNGLGVRSSNLGIDYLNSLSDAPFLQKRAVPGDPALSVVHRSEQHGLFTTFGFMDGVRNRHDDLAPAPSCRPDPTQCGRKEAFDPALDAGLERRGVPIGPVPTNGERKQELHHDEYAPSQGSALPRSDNDLFFDRAFSAYMGRDDRALTTVMDDYRQSPIGQAWAQHQHDYAQDLRTQEQESLRQAAFAEQEQQQTMQRAPAMRM